ncbi:MAG: hypothetical protein ACLRSW_08165 [Christensenellaceae bacterium]
MKVGIITFLRCFQGRYSCAYLVISCIEILLRGDERSRFDFTRYFCEVWVIIGHIFPVTMKFKAEGHCIYAGTFDQSRLRKSWFLLIGFAAFC